MGTKKATTTSNQNSTTTTQLPEWMLQAGQANYGKAQSYMDSPDAVWSADKAASYANPFAQQVQAKTMATMAHDNQTELQGVGDAAVAAKAFGGTRQAVLESQVRNDQGNRMANYEATSNADAYDKARSEFDNDRATKMSGFQLMQQILAATPRNVTTVGSSTGSGTSTETPSLLSQLMGAGQIAASAFSDRRLKTAIRWIDQLANGLGVYGYRYVWDRPDQVEHIGVMADEVERIMPEALGPVVGGFKTVDYSKLGGLLPC